MIFLSNPPKLKTILEIESENDFKNKVVVWQKPIKTYEGIGYTWRVFDTSSGDDLCVQ